MKEQIFNPYLPSWEYVPDGEPHIFGDRLYLYGSHDKFGGSNYCQNDYVCWSAPVNNLTDWSYEGVIYKKEQDPHKKGAWDLYAPDVAQGRDGRYYLYYSANGSSFVSVAVCDTPAGKYEYYGDVIAADGHIQGTAPDDDYMFDPAIFVDDDGKIYLYSGFNLPVIHKVAGHRAKGAYVMELAEDMKTVVKEPKKIMGEKFCNLHTFFEASSMRKFDGIYYFIYSSNSSHELCYATCNKPDGIFKYQGRLLSNGNIGFSKQRFGSYPMGNNHGSIVKINKTYYVFGHRHTNRNGFTRQGIAQRIERKPDGTFVQAEYTSAGLNDGDLIGNGKYPAYIACYLAGKRRKSRPYITQNGGDREAGERQFVAAITDGACVGFKYFNFRNTKLTRINVCGKWDGLVKILTDETTQIGTAHLKLQKCEDWQNITLEIPVPDGRKGLYFQFEGKGMLKFMEFELVQQGKMNDKIYSKK